MVCSGWLVLGVKTVVGAVLLVFYLVHIGRLWKLQLLLCHEMDSLPADVEMSTTNNATRDCREVCREIIDEHSIIAPCPSVAVPPSVLDCPIVSCSSVSSHGSDDTSNPPSPTVSPILSSTLSNIQEQLDDGIDDDDVASGSGVHLHRNDSSLDTLPASSTSPPSNDDVTLETTTETPMTTIEQLLTSSSITDLSPSQRIPFGLYPAANIRSPVVGPLVRVASPRRPPTAVAFTPRPITTAVLTSAAPPFTSTTTSSATASASTTDHGSTGTGHTGAATGPPQYPLYATAAPHGLPLSWTGNLPTVHGPTAVVGAVPLVSNTTVT